MNLPKLPPQPPESDWQFIADLRTAKYHQPLKWKPRKPARGEAAFPEGLSLQIDFPDPRGLLETAYADFRFFLSTVSLPADGPYPLIIRPCETSIHEEYLIHVYPDRCELCAADTEGIRRGLIYLEDELQRRGGPFLPLGTIKRTPLVRTRISRCFYGPINRPPKCREELADDVDYYPEEYLNRLAHEGVNVLWMTINWFDTIPSKIIPEYGQNSAFRLEKLRRTVAKCERYGIRIYPFCIEPASLNRPEPVVQAAAKAHPELIGHNGSFCTSTEKGQAYVEEAVRTLFEEVPGLGGLIVIPVGERQTHCYSGAIPDGGSWPTPNKCPRCSKRKPYEVLWDTVSAMRRGMDAVNPEAEIVAWPYGQFICWGPEKTIEAAAHCPPGVILQHNFETGGQNLQLGKLRPTWDYWLSYVGPSDLFQGAATAAIKHGARAGAKLQVGCSHEVATIQVVPAPGRVYRKYSAIHKLGVSAAMESWYFGTYPSLMTRAAGELSFAPFPKTNRDFLRSLAERDYGEYSEQIVDAWEWFEKGYHNYPTAHVFGYYGPMHDGPAWPLYLIPRRLPLASTWQIPYPPSGDYVGMCVTNGFTLAEMVTLCGRMTDYWQRGVEIIKRIRKHFTWSPERVLDLNLAVALGLQFRSGYNILRFYQLREKLADAKSPAVKQRLLADLKALVRAEMKVTEELIPLAEADSRLGFHSEAEGYKYHPALLRWRLEQLKQLLTEEFPPIEKQARQPGSLFPDYTGEAPTGPVFFAPKAGAEPELTGRPVGGAWDEAPEQECVNWLRHVANPDRRRKCAYDPCDHLPVDPADHDGRTTTWKAIRTDDAILIGVTCQAGERKVGEGEALQIYVEPTRTQPRRIFHISPGGDARCQQDDGYIPRQNAGWSVETKMGKNEWSAVLRIPLEWLGQKPGRKPRPLRVNIIRQMPIASAPGGAECSWAKREPAQGRLVWGDLNPATDFGWLKPN